LSAGNDELIPAALARRLIGGEAPVRVWREYRGMTVRSLAVAAGVDMSDVERIESDDQHVGIDILKKISTVLDVAIDDLV
jgi:transcriptional regulator with XRE-family HTH domain